DDLSGPHGSRATLSAGPCCAAAKNTALHQRLSRTFRQRSFAFRTAVSACKRPVAGVAVTPPYARVPPGRFLPPGCVSYSGGPSLATKRRTKEQPAAVGRDELQRYYREMLLIRRFEEKAGQLYGM